MSRSPSKHRHRKHRRSGAERGHATRDLGEASSVQSAKPSPGTARGPSEFALSVGRGLKLAAAEARRLARLHGTPVWGFENGKVVPRSGWGRLVRRITMNPSVEGGRPCVRDTGIRCSQILRMLASGMTESQILARHRRLEKQDVRAVLRFATRVVSERRLIV